jgi:hypothetical protein
VSTGGDQVTTIPFDPLGTTSRLAGGPGLLSLEGVPCAVAAGDDPAADWAVSDRSYVTPSVSPLSVVWEVEADGLAVTTTTLFSEALRVYPVSGAPPSSAGGAQFTISEAERASTDVISGADGGWATIGTTVLEGVLAALVPHALVAVIVTVYGTPAQMFVVTSIPVDVPGVVVGPVG